MSLSQPTPRQLHIKDLESKRLDQIVQDCLMLQILGPAHTGLGQLVSRLKTSRAALLTTIAVIRHHKDKARYPDHMQVRLLYPHGDIHYLGKRMFLTEGLRGEYIGVEHVYEDVSLLWYCNYLLGQVDHKKSQIVPAKSRPLICAYAQISDYKPEKVLPMYSV